MVADIRLFPIGTVHISEDEKWIQLEERYVDGLLGLDAFSHIAVIYWFHRNDSADKRWTLRVHPRGDHRNPLTGVFATHSPQRPNLIALTVCKMLSVAGDKIYVEDIDALDGSPVLDLKCHIPTTIPQKDLRLPDWIR